MLRRDMDCPTILHTRAAQAVRIVLLATLASSLASADSLPRVEDLLKGSAFDSKEIERVLAGEIAVTTVKHPSDRELAVGIACLVADDVDPMKPFDRSRPMLPGDSIREFQPIDPSDPDAAFGKIEITSTDREELRRYLDFEEGLGLNLSPDEVATFRREERKHSKPAPLDVVNAVVRRALRDRFDAYRAKGLAGIAPYVREGGELVAPGDELGTIIDQSRVLRKLFPEFMAIWEDYPNSTTKAQDEAFYWIRSTVDDRPMFTLAHQMSWGDGTTRLRGERLFYASHFFNAGQTIVVSTPTQEGRLFALIERLWIDGYSSFSSVKHSVGEKMLTRQMLEKVERRESCVVD
jgi:hypothetical protein